MIKQSLSFLGWVTLTCTCLISSLAGWLWGGEHSVSNIRGQQVSLLNNVNHAFWVIFPFWWRKRLYEPNSFRIIGGKFVLLTEFIVLIGHRKEFQPVFLDYHSTKIVWIDLLNNWFIRQRAFIKIWSTWEVWRAWKMRKSCLRHSSMNAQLTYEPIVL